MYWCGNTYTTLSARVATQDTYIFCKVVLNCIHVRVCVCRYRKLSRRTHRKWLIVSILEDDGSLCIGGKSVLHPVFLNCSHFLPWACIVYMICKNPIISAKRKCLQHNKYHGSNSKLLPAVAVTPQNPASGGMGMEWEGTSQKKQLVVKGRVQGEFFLQKAGQGWGPGPLKFCPVPPLIVTPAHVPITHKWQ